MFLFAKQLKNVVMSVHSPAKDKQLQITLLLNYVSRFALKLMVIMFLFAKQLQNFVMSVYSPVTDILFFSLKHLC